MPKDPPEPCELTDLRKALTRFAFPTDGTQSAKHIRSLHWYVACRLVIEGGFRPEEVTPRPPFEVEKTARGYYLHHAPALAGWGERTVIGGLKTKDVDVTVCKPGIGPVLAVSLKGTLRSFRNLTNRMEEAAGDCTNLHLSYPAMVYAFWHLLRGNEADDPEPQAYFELDTKTGRYTTADTALDSSLQPMPGVKKYALALSRLSGRSDMRQDPSRYEGCALTLVNVRKGASDLVHHAYPAADHVLDFNGMFQRLYSQYDERFVFQAPTLSGITRRLEWHRDSAFLAHTVATGASFDEMEVRYSG